MMSKLTARVAKLEHDRALTGIRPPDLTSDEFLDLIVETMLAQPAGATADQQIQAVKHWVLALTPEEAKTLVDAIDRTNAAILADAHAGEPHTSVEANL